MPFARIPTGLTQSTRTLTAVTTGGIFAAGVWFVAPPQPKIVPPAAPAAQSAMRTACDDEVDGAAFAGAFCPVPTPPIVQLPGDRPAVALPSNRVAEELRGAADQALMGGDLDTAFHVLREYLAASGPTPALLLEIASLGRELRHYELAEEALAKAGELAPKNADVPVELARVMLASGDIGRARTAAQAALQLDREDAEAWNVAGRIAMASDEWQRAEHAFKKAIALAPNDGLLENNLGLLYVRMRQPGKAREHIEQALEIYGDDAPFFVYNNLGLALELSGELEEACMAFEEALIANPDYVRAQVNLARVRAAVAARRGRGTDWTRTSPTANHSLSSFGSWDETGASAVKVIVDS